MTIVTERIHPALILILMFIKEDSKFQSWQRYNRLPAFL
jgi:hypothetical protein